MGAMDLRTFANFSIPPQPPVTRPREAPPQPRPPPKKLEEKALTRYNRLTISGPAFIRSILITASKWRSSGVTRNYQPIIALPSILLDVPPIWVSLGS
jgi:hypothetical protein